VIQTIERLMADDTAGDPMTGLRWTHKTTKKIRRALEAASIYVSPTTVARLLKQRGYSLRVNRKQIARGNCEYRDRQFEYIKRLRHSFAKDALPVVSVDTKKKELIGLFKNPGAVWCKEPVKVNDHDFRSDGKGLAVPYGVLDLEANRGHVCVGMSHDTPQFAVHALAQWWSRTGRSRYPGADRLLVLADNGGSNGSRVRAWKHQLQTQLCDRFRISVTVCHYPPGTSKWNPIEHRLFSEISKNWAGCPLDSFDTVLNYIRTTKTDTGLSVTATLDRRQYFTGMKPTAEDMARVHIEPHRTLPAWNYTLRPAFA
jgi:hypothetical protein